MLSTPQRFARWLTAAQPLQFDRLWHSITLAVKKMNHPRSSQPLSVFICDKEVGSGENVR
jgi:hypothetical protein